MITQDKEFMRKLEKRMAIAKIDAYLAERGLIRKEGQENPPDTIEQANTPDLEVFWEDVTQCQAGYFRKWGIS